MTTEAGRFSSNVGFHDPRSVSGQPRTGLHSRRRIAGPTNRLTFLLPSAIVPIRTVQEYPTTWSTRATTCGSGIAAHRAHAYRASQRLLLSYRSAKPSRFLRDTSAVGSIAPRLCCAWRFVIDDGNDRRYPLAKKSSANTGKNTKKGGEGWKSQGGYTGSGGKGATITRRPPRQPGR